MMGVDYPQQQLTVSGGVSPYTWALAGGSALPIGMMLSSSGILSGVPAAQRDRFRLRAVVGNRSRAKTIQGSMTFLWLTIRAISGRRT